MDYELINKRKIKLFFLPLTGGTSALENAGFLRLEFSYLSYPAEFAGQ